MAGTSDYSEADIANLVLQMKGMEVLDRDCMALVPAGTFSRSLWHAAALSTELNRLLRIQQQLYKHYQEQSSPTSTIQPSDPITDNTAAETSRLGKVSTTAMVPYNRSYRRRKQFQGDYNNYLTDERFKWKKRSYPVDNDTKSGYVDLRPQKRRLRLPMQQFENAILNEEDMLSYSRINGKPLYEDRRFKLSEIQVYLLDLINQDRARKMEDIRKASTSYDHEVDGKIVEIENFAHACKSELTIAFAITQGLRHKGLEGNASEFIRDSVVPEILRKAGVTFTHVEELTKPKPTVVHPPDNECYGETIQEFPDD